MTEVRVLALHQRQLADVRPDSHVRINERRELAANLLDQSACLLRVGDEMFDAGRSFERGDELGPPDALEIGVSVLGSRHGIGFVRLSDSRR